LLPRLRSVALFAIGLSLSLYTGRSAVRGGIRMAAIACSRRRDVSDRRLLGVAIG